jgi:hypothetical protein
LLKSKKNPMKPKGLRVPTVDRRPRRRSSGNLVRDVGSPREPHPRPRVALAVLPGSRVHAVGSRGQRSPGALRPPPREPRALTGKSWGRSGAPSGPQARASGRYEREGEMEWKG